MLSFTNKDNEKKTICVIKNNDKIIENVYLYDKIDKSFEGFESLELVDSFHFQIVPDLNKERDCIYIAGSSGSGKSFACVQYLKEYIRLHPKNPIYLFSYLTNDETIDKVKKIQRIDIHNKEFINENLDTKDFENSMIVLDDVDCLEDKALKNKILGFFKKILQIGRHGNISVCYLCHEITNGNETKAILNESHSISFFPKTIGSKKLKYLCDSYLGMNKEETNKIKSLDSRCITVLKSYPKIVIAEKNIYIL
jgi:hypothetical protein